MTQTVKLNCIAIFILYKFFALSLKKIPLISTLQ